MAETYQGHGPWNGADVADVRRWCQELYGCSLETWEQNRERWERADAEDTRRSLYPTPSERIADDR